MLLIVENNILILLNFIIVLIILKVMKLKIIIFMVDNYRPVAILSNFTIMFEMSLYTQIYRVIQNLSKIYGNRCTMKNGLNIIKKIKNAYSVRVKSYLSCSIFNIYIAWLL